MRDYSSPCCQPEFWAYLTICVLLVLLAGITSGLALGLLSFSQVDLEVLIKAGKPQDQKNAARIRPIVKDQHLLLCTLMVVKSLAIEALPIFVDTILPIWASIVISVILVVAFSEIIPQAVCSRYGLTIGARSAVLVRFLIVICYPIAYPISKLLDWLLGKGHSALLRRAELKTLVDLHANEAGKGGDLSQYETTIISGALDLTQKKAKDAMTPISETFALDINSKLDLQTMDLITSKGHSRIPIYSARPDNIIGLILAKNLIFCRPEDEVPIKSMTIRRIPRVYEDWPLYNILNQFQKGHSHMAIVVKSNKELKNNTNTQGSSSILDIVDNSGPNPPQEERKGNNSEADENEIPSVYASPLLSIETSPQNKRREKATENFPYVDLGSLPNNLDEEVVGIITMEDVLEELLQEEILDETDEYIDVHNKIRINLLSSRSGRFSSRSLGGVSFSRPSSKTTPEPYPAFTSIPAYSAAI